MDIKEELGQVVEEMKLSSKLMDEANELRGKDSNLWKKLDTANPKEFLKDYEKGRILWNQAEELSEKAMKLYTQADLIVAKNGKLMKKIEKPNKKGLEFDKHSNIIFHKPTSTEGIIKEFIQENHPKQHIRRVGL